MGVVRGRWCLGLGKRGSWTCFAVRAPHLSFTALVGANGLIHIEERMKSIFGYGLCDEKICWLEYKTRFRRDGTWLAW